MAVTGRKVGVVDGGLVALEDSTTTGTSTVTWVQQQATYTQTYSTATRTVAAATVAAVATTAATDSTPFGYASAAQADAIPVAINALTADVLVLRKLINSLIDDFQAVGLVA